MGAFLAGMLGGNGMSRALGTDNKFQANNPYDYSVLQEQLNRQSQVYQGQEELAKQLQMQMQGQGPNTAQNLYNQNVQQNIASGQGMISSQRGLNPALATKMGANMAAQGNQQAAANSALLQQQQQLGATANLGNLYGNMQQNNLGQQQLYVAPNTAAMQTNAGVAGSNQQAAKDIIGGLISGAGQAAMMAAHGGVVSGHADGGLVDSDPTQLSTDARSQLAQSLRVPQSFGQPAMASGGQVPALVSPGEIYLNPSKASAVAQGQASPMSGERIKGKEMVKGDSLKNDTVSKTLEEGGVVVPKSVAQGKDAKDKSAAFVAAVLGKQGMRKQ